MQVILGILGQFEWATPAPALNIIFGFRLDILDLKLWEVTGTIQLILIIPIKLRQLDE